MSSDPTLRWEVKVQEMGSLIVLIKKQNKTKKPKQQKSLTLIFQAAIRKVLGIKWYKVVLPKRPHGTVSKTPVPRMGLHRTCISHSVMCSEAQTECVVSLAPGSPLQNGG